MRTETVNVCCGVRRYAEFMVLLPLLFLWNAEKLPELTQTPAISWEMLTEINCPIENTVVPFISIRTETVSITEYSGTELFWDAWDSCWTGVKATTNFTTKNRVFKISLEHGGKGVFYVYVCPIEISWEYNISKYKLTNQRLICCIHFGLPL